MRPQALLALGNVTYDRETETLRDASGADIAIRPQSAHTLKLLAANVGDTVSKDTLVHEVWSGVSVTDDSLVQCIADIRRTIGDKTRQILRTVPKKGYCLIASEVARPADPAVQPNDAVSMAMLLAQRTGTQVRFGLQPGDPTHFTAQKSSIAALAQRYNGTVVPAPQGELAVDCTNAMKATALALAARQWCAAHAAQGGAQTHLRIGIDMGCTGDMPAPRTQAMMNMAQPGDIIIPAEVAQMLTPGLDCDILDIGDCLLPGLDERVRCFKVFERTSAPVVSQSVSREDLLPTVAVIPFKPRFPDPEAAILGEVLADDVISLLSRSLEINVISRLSTTKFRHRDASLTEIGKLLGTHYVLSGRYAARAGKLEVLAELSEVSTGRVLWVDSNTADVDQSYDAPELIDWMVTGLQKAIYTRAVAQVRQQPLPTLDTYTLLMSAVALMHRLSPGDFNKAKLLLDAVIARAPKQAAPIAWLARWHVLRVQQGLSPAPQDEVDPALDLTKRALDMDPDNVLALVSEGMVLTNLKRRLDDAEDRYNRALDISPNDAVGRLLRGTMFAFRGDGANAIKDTEHSLRLAPLDPLRFFFLSLTASAYITAEKYEDALNFSELSLRANSTHTSTLRVKAVALMRLNRVTEARATGEKLLKLQPNLRVSDWIKNSPSGDYAVGKAFGDTMKQIGIPD